MIHEMRTTFTPWPLHSFLQSQLKQSIWQQFSRLVAVAASALFANWCPLSTPFRRHNQHVVAPGFPPVWICSQFTFPRCPCSAWRCGRRDDPSTWNHAAPRCRFNRRWGEKPSLKKWTFLVELSNKSSAHNGSGQQSAMAFLTNRHVEREDSVEDMSKLGRKHHSDNFLILASLTTGCFDDYGLRHRMNENQHWPERLLAWHRWTEINVWDYFIAQIKKKLYRRKCP